MSALNRPEFEISQGVTQDANTMVRDLAVRCSQKNGFGSFSIFIYDTAWLAMIQAPEGSWLFPESYSYLLLHQSENGAWPAYASPIDGILNTLAGLLALVKHHKLGAFKIDDPHLEAWNLPSRIGKAQGAVGSALRNWDVNQTIHVGFEVLVPSLLSQLSREGIVFGFEGRSPPQAQSAYS